MTWGILVETAIIPCLLQKYYVFYHTPYTHTHTHSALQNVNTEHHQTFTQHHHTLTQHHQTLTKHHHTHTHSITTQTQPPLATHIKTANISVLTLTLGLHSCPRLHSIQQHTSLARDSSNKAWVWWKLQLIINIRVMFTLWLGWNWRGRWWPTSVI